MEIFELFLKIPIFETNGNSVYYKLEQGGIANVATSIARRDLNPVRVNCQTRASAPRNPARDRRADVKRQFPTGQVLVYSRILEYEQDFRGSVWLLNSCEG